MKEKLNNFWRYRFLLENLISRDIKIKYRRSKLGIAWSVLNPLLMMLVMTLVFSHFFRFDIENYPVYILTGQLLFTYFNDSTSNSMSSVVNNYMLIKKVYVPKYIFPIEKSCFCFINMLFSLIALFGVMLITKAPLYLSILGIILPLILLFFFCTGVGLFLAAGAVYFRDVMHFWQVFITALTYATPVFYPEAIWEGTFMMTLGRLNPMYWYLSAFRTCVIAGTLPSAGTMVQCALFALIAMAVGSFTFYKTQDNFILYI